MIKQITVFLRNEPGSLYDVTSKLSKEDIDIRAISMVETSDMVFMRIVPAEAEKAGKVLEDAGIQHAINDVLGVQVEDKPGGLMELAALFAKNKINIEYTYPLVTKGGTGNAYMIVSTESQSRAEKLLEKNGVKLLDEQDFYGI